ncbi:hypothetical protein H072_10075 [Dactylellina haptotyla CBS 200.50]|uniref:Uncharacterized protein n=1 Tax=Dactylellina haptotyla (strain CBS 200.50) TaxID=1284197 RepID=S8BMH8_DACHA|nr:hypothetical protein H072_10075 [Dactylellina haptotyla CBS 200.50]
MHGSRFVANKTVRHGPLSLACTSHEHIWIPESLVADSFRTFSARFISTPRAAGPISVRKCRWITRGLHTIGPQSTPQNPNPKDDQPSPIPEGLFSWSSMSRATDGAQFTYSPLSSWKDAALPDGPEKERDILETLSPKDDHGGTVSRKLSFGDWTWTTGMSRKSTKPPARPFLGSSKEFHDRLNNLINHGTRTSTAHGPPFEELPIVPQDVQRALSSIMSEAYPPKEDTNSENSAHAAIEVVLAPPATTKPTDTDTRTSKAEPVAIPELQPLEIDIVSVSPVETSHPAEVQLPEARIEILAEAMSPTPAEVAESSSVQKEPILSPQTTDALSLSMANLRKSKRTFVHSTPLAEVEPHLHNVLIDPSVPDHTLYLIHSQIDIIYGVENLLDPGKYLKLLSERLVQATTDYGFFLSKHPTVRELINRNDVDKITAGKLTNSNHAPFWLRFGNKIVDEPFGDHLSGGPITADKIRRTWNRILRLQTAIIQQPDNPRTTERKLPVPAVMFVLDEAINVLNRPVWDSEMSQMIGVVVEIFHYYRHRDNALALLFPHLVKFIISWQSKWGTKEFEEQSMILQKTARTIKLRTRGQARKLRREEGRPVPDLLKTIHIYPNQIVGLKSLLNTLPREYVDRLLATILLQAPNRKVHPPTDAWQLRRIHPLAPWCQGVKSPPDNSNLHSLFFLEDPITKYAAEMKSKDDEAIATFLRGATDHKIITFHLNFWLARRGFPGISDPVFLNTLRRDTMGEICLRGGNTIDRYKQVKDPKLPGLPFAQAILSLFYLGIPPGPFTNELFSTLILLGRKTRVKSCLDILRQFEGRSNGEMIFRIPRRTTKRALVPLSQTDPFWSLDLLNARHHLNRKTVESVLLRTAVRYPNETYRFFSFLLEPVTLHSISNVGSKDIHHGRGHFSKDFLANLAARYAISDYHSPNVATRRITHIRRLLGKYGYGTDIRVSRALVAAGMIRTSIHRLWADPARESMDDMFKHGRLKYAITKFLQDADKDPKYLKGLTHEEAKQKKRDFVEKCMMEVWDEITKFKRHQAALKAKRESMATTRI